jgi:hypothetical protein
MPNAITGFTKHNYALQTSSILKRFCIFEVQLTEIAWKERDNNI